ncbi:MAG TPA: hypothetical protein VFU43_07795 [Streptosporangiaceae bacterium]|nr:hypothetical protein [Streptosporangiaceae bacterium]
MNPSTQQPVAPPLEAAQAGGRSRSRALPATAVVVAVAGALTAVAWVTGGLRSQSAAPPPRAKPGATVDQGRFTVQVVGAHTEMTKVGFDNKLVPALVVRMKVTNTGKETVLMDNGVFGFTAGVFLEPGRPADSARDDAAKGTAMTLQPRLPRDVDVIWKWTGAPPAQVTLDLRKWTYHLQFDRGGYFWSTGKDAPTVSVVTLPVRHGGAA